MDIHPGAIADSGAADRQPQPGISGNFYNSSQSQQHGAGRAHADQYAVSNAGRAYSYPRPDRSPDSDADAAGSTRDADNRVLSRFANRYPASDYRDTQRLPVAMPEQPLIVTLISDLFFAAPVERAVHEAGYRLERIERGSDLEEEQPEQERGRVYLGEPLSGRGAAFIRRLAEWRPALILVELSSTSIPWADWIAAVKASPATRRIPVIGFGPHTDLELRTQAMDAGFDLVIAKSRLLSALPELIEKHARLVDYGGLQTDCEGQLSDLALKGIALFNERAYFEAHEELELAWGAESGPIRELYRGILQVAVAYLHITRHNYRGAMKMFLRLRQWLDPLPDECMGVNVAQLRAEALAARAEVEKLGPEKIAAFDLSLLKPVQLQPRAN